MELLKGEEQRLSGCLCPHLKSDLRHAHEDALAHTSSVMHVFIAILPRKSISLHLFTADIHLHSLNIEIYSIEYTHTQTLICMHPNTRACKHRHPHPEKAAIPTSWNELFSFSGRKGVFFLTTIFWTFVSTVPFFFFFFCTYKVWMCKRTQVAVKIA